MFLLIEGMKKKDIEKCIIWDKKVIISIHRCLHSCGILWHKLCFIKIPPLNDFHSYLQPGSIWKRSDIQEKKPVKISLFLKLNTAEGFYYTLFCPDWGEIEALSSLPRVFKRSVCFLGKHILLVYYIWPPTNFRTTEGSSTALWIRVLNFEGYSYSIYLFQWWELCLKPIAGTGQGGKSPFSHAEPEYTLFHGHCPTSSAEQQLLSLLNPQNKQLRITLLWTHTRRHGQLCVTPG